MKYLTTIFLYTIIFLSSCISDKSLVGVWECEASNGRNTLHLYEDKTFKWLREDALLEPLIEGKWSKSGNTLLLDYKSLGEKESFVMEYKIKMHRDSLLIIQWPEPFNYTYEFIRKY